jgi:SOS response regulatory protein OraA/RecX
MSLDPAKKLLHKATSLLARRAFSRGELCARLGKFGETQQIDAVLDQLQHWNLLNDEDYAYNFASRWIRDEGWGPARVVHRLVQRKLAASVAETAVDRVLQEVGADRALESYLDRYCRSRKLPADRKGIQKLFQSLMRRGYSSEVIWSVLRQRIPSSAWRDFQTGD